MSEEALEARVLELGSDFGAASDAPRYFVVLRHLVGGKLEVSDFVGQKAFDDWYAGPSCFRGQVNRHFVVIKEGVPEDEARRLVSSSNARKVDESLAEVRRILAEIGKMFPNDRNPERISAHLANSCPPPAP